MLYAVLFWCTLYLLRGRIVRFPVLIAGVAAAVGAIHGIARLLFGDEAGSYSLVLHLGELYAFLLLTVGLTIVLFAKRRAPADCRHCGYDLRGNASGICPECANEVPAYQRRTIDRLQEEEEADSSSRPPSREMPSVTRKPTPISASAPTA